ncbi:MAG: hydroxysqualene dehydroxylase HpnE [Actinobacteria bacterium]|jgi:squalene-associated FAD-dependent desaturase|nr:hydroxysqualene dehydroxylase HpnE [Actinomycetota bacterium]MCL6095412.1 hydroxysqualene dehydroxylase HpnE [Actinomycetota bacterium]
MTARVIVVGGGLAGMAAALELAERGSQVTLLEMRPMFGGMTRSLEKEGMLVDNGQHVFMKCCSAYIDFLRRIGSLDGVYLQDRLEIPVVRPGGRVSWIRRDSLHPPLHLLRTLFQYSYLDWRGKLKVAQVMSSLSRMDPSDKSLDDHSFGSWLSARGKENNSANSLFDLLVRSTLNLPPEEASLQMVTKVVRTGFLSQVDGADLGWSNLPLSELHGRRAARALMSRDVEMLASTKVNSIEAGAGGEPVVNLANGRSEKADSVVVAVDHRTAQRLLPRGAIYGQERLSSLGTSPILSVHVLYDRKVMDYPFMASLDTSIQWVFDRSASLEVAGSTTVPGAQYLTIPISAAYPLISKRTNSIISKVLPALEALLPRASRAVVLRATVTREAAATFRASPRSAELRPGSTTRFEGLFVAGAWCDTGWPATMEGAVRSGFAAASAVAKFLGSRHEEGLSPSDEPSTDALAVGNLAAGNGSEEKSCQGGQARQKTKLKESA